MDQLSFPLAEEHIKQNCKKIGKITDIAINLGTQFFSKFL